ncbi:restriction endonuclease subunit S [Prevotella jejuni]|uniref:restriction endonuclease subunit S n=1 Tax=Prevotella jejuni TaxID=1177574 RepID=UPI0028DBD6D4|nr:restriction endonuclease subunit S [Prevotella jejuni]
MKKYDEYKDSGVAWIGEVPKHWEVIKLKFKYHFQTGATPNTGKKENFEGELKWANISDLNGSVVYDTTKHINKEAASKCSMNISPKGSLMYSFKLSVGTVAFCGEDMYTNEAIASFIPQKNDLKYLFYCAPIFIIHNANRNIYNAPLLNQELIKNALICLPSLNEQTAIATYLDTHCAKIDNLISIQQKRIVLLQELKQSVITHAVTKGLNPNVEMKQSGVEWIGDVPKHWELVRTRYLCNLCTGSKDTINRVDDGKYPFYVRSPKVERIDTYSFDGEAILMAGDGVGAGKVFHYAVGKFDYHQRVYNFHNFKHVLGKFFYNYISNNFKYIIEEGGAKNTVDSVRLYMIQNFMTTVPPLEEQMEICNYIEQKEKVFDTSISNAQHQIELLQEYKQSLITEVVTGKRKVTDN